MIANQFTQRLPVDIFHRDEVHAIVLTDFINVRDVGMIERRRRLRFANEPFHAIAVQSHLGGQNL